MQIKDKKKVRAFKKQNSKKQIAFKISKKDILEFHPVQDAICNNDFNKSSPGIRGITNISSENCSLCAALQLLLHSMPLVKLLLKTNWESHIDSTKTPIARMLKDLAVQLWMSPVELVRSKAEPINPKEVLTYLLTDGSIEKTQNDALEILIILITKLHIEFKSIDPNPIEQIFYGITREEHVCVNCGNSCTRNIPFNCISLLWTHEKQYKLKTMFENFSQWFQPKLKEPEPCENCKKKHQLK